MNTWIAKLGTTHFENSSVDKLKKWSANTYGIVNHEIVEHKSNHVHYFSICPNPDKWNKDYHYKTESLFGYSGLIAATTQTDTDFRSAKNIYENLDSLSDIYKIASGHFSLFKADDNTFECIVDALPAYKVFYYQFSPDEIYVSNNPLLIKLFKEPETNIFFYLNYITADGTYGTETDSKGIFTLPAFGRLRWDTVNGLKIDRYTQITDLIQNDKTSQQLLDQLALEYRNVAKYIVTYHKAAISQSGGYDSRIAINMFNGLNRDNILCYTFPDHPNDRKLAKKVVDDHNFRLKYIKTSKIPDLDTLHGFLEKEQAPFINYNNVFGYVTHDGISSIYEKPEHVQFIGLGGEAYQNFTKFDCSNTQCEEEINLAEFHNAIKNSRNKPEDKLLFKIGMLTNLLINRKVLTDPGYQTIRDRIINYYYNTYYDILSSSELANYQIANVHFLFERVGNYQAFKHYFYGSSKDYFLPFGSRSMLQTILSISAEHLYRHKKGSIHHELSKRLTNGNAKRIHFTRGIHWDATKLERYKYHRIDPKIDKLKSKIFPPDKKFTSTIRKKFFQDHLDHYRQIIYDHHHSELWNYIDHEKIKALFENNTDLYKNHSNLICKVVPLLKKGI